MTAHQVYGKSAAPALPPKRLDTRVLAPVTSRGEAVGVLELVLPFKPASFTCEADQFTLAGWLEPAGEVGGDTFTSRWIATRCLCL